MKSYYNGPIGAGEFRDDVTFGMVPGFTALDKFGQNVDVSASASEDIWDIGGDFPGARSTAVQYNVRSASAQDSAASGFTGASSVTVYGLDANYLQQQETINLNGTSNVTTTNSYVIIFRMTVDASGSSAGAVGNIQATPAASGATATAQITQGNNQTLMAVYMVPGNCEMAINSYYFGENIAGAADDISVAVQIEPFNSNTRQTRHLTGGRVTGGIPYYHNFSPAILVPSKAVVYLRATAGSNNTSVFGGFNAVLRNI